MYIVDCIASLSSLLVLATPIVLLTLGMNDMCMRVRVTSKPAQLEFMATNLRVVI